ncbi:MAG TPA: heavy-metal-associated domain-containing protein [Methylococcaceae bacterium]|nr:heavy-metal-associated domain-containing protein [Methylococcaceae bacterium]
MEKITLRVEGMKCGGCENIVRAALEACAGVVAARPSHKDKVVEVEFDPARVNVDALQQAIVKAGYSVI